jgi:hypothetical protein
MRFIRVVEIVMPPRVVNEPPHKPVPDPRETIGIRLRAAALTTSTT